MVPIPREVLQLWRVDMKMDGRFATVTCARAIWPTRIDAVVRGGRRLRLAVAWAVVFGLLSNAPSVAFLETPYLAPHAVDLIALLPPPPVSDSQAQTDDVSTVVALQAQAPPERRREAIADAEVSPGRFAGALLGPAFTAAKAPKTFALLRRITNEGGRLTETAKDHWNRPRPFAVDPRVKSLVPTPRNPAYPSGHTTFAYEMAVVLGAMLPERRDALFARASDYGQSRIIVGVHFLTDINAGRIAGTSIAAVLLATPQFRADLAEATSELRQTLGAAAAK